MVKSTTKSDLLKGNCKMKDLETVFCFNICHSTCYFWLQFLQIFSKIRPSQGNPLSFAIGINMANLDNLFMTKKSFKLLICTPLMSDTCHLAVIHMWRPLWKGWRLRQKWDAIRRRELEGECVRQYSGRSIFIFLLKKSEFAP